MSFFSRERKGKYLKTTIIDDRFESVFHEVDNLDTKGLDQTKNNYEEAFVRIRLALQDKPWCCDSREDILNICQLVADELKDNLLIRKGN